MHRVPNEDSIVSRARWLAELADALNEAQRMTTQLADEGVPESIDLSRRIEAAKLEVQALRLRRSFGGVRHFDPEWTEGLPWRRSA